MVELHLKRISKTCIGSNSTRGNLEEGGLNILRQNLYRIVKLDDLMCSGSEEKFKSILDSYTSKLKQKLGNPVKHEHWGLCRKAITLYLRDCYYNKTINTHFMLDEIASYFETPIDSLAMKALKDYSSTVGKTPLKLLDKSTHHEWQKAATNFVKAKCLANRVDADLIIY
jgi:hypothetical protein